LEAGPLVDRSGTVLGEHDGYAGFTVGQRKGLGGGFSEPMYVLEIRPGTREVVVGPAEELDAGGVRVAELNWLTEPPGKGDSVSVQCRSRSRPVPAVVREMGTDRLDLRFERPHRAVTPGQSAVVFRGGQLLGGGRIVRSLSGPPGISGEAPSSPRSGPSAPAARP